MIYPFGMLANINEEKKNIYKGFYEYFSEILLKVMHTEALSSVYA
jgi:hypothetical protein